MRPYTPASIGMPTFLFVVLAGAIGLNLIALTSAVAQDEEYPVVLLFVQNAHGITYDADTGKMTLLRVSPVVTFFSDRPNRVAGHVRQSSFVDAWDEGKDSFEEDPPNASLSILDEDDIKSVIVELLNPRIVGNDFVYDVKVLNGHLPAAGGACSLFIDGLFTGRSGLKGGAVGGLVGAATGNVGAGIAIGAATGIVGGAIKRDKDRSAAERAVNATRTVNVVNGNGSFSPVNLVLVQGGWQGPKGEIYPTLPTADQLKSTYGIP